ncbi:transposase family protein [bacterium]|nr:transposase family protein [bacterium]
MVAPDLEGATMAFREVTMLEIKEVVLLWLDRVPKKRIAKQLGVDVKSVRRYLAAAAELGLAPGTPAAALTDELCYQLALALEPNRERVKGEAWLQCEGQRAFIAGHLSRRVRLTKVHRLLQRQGTDVPYATLYRFSVSELDFGRRAATVPVIDGEPGCELQVDTGWMTYLEPDATGRRRRIRAWIFTPNVSRYRFVWPCFQETIESAIEACEAAWEFYGGVFRVLVPDNTKVIVDQSDPTGPRLNRTFLEYAQARGFHIDPTRVRSPQDKGRVERTVSYVRDDCFTAEHLTSLAEARQRARFWSGEEAGLRRCRSTGRLPREHFQAVEQAHLLPAPIAAYDIPLWCEPKVARDHLAQVARAVYSLPTALIGRRLTARADSSLVRFYDGQKLVKTHPRQPPGGRSIDPHDFPAHKTAYAMRDVAFLQRKADRDGPVIGRYAAALLDGPLPWASMRSVYALLALVRRYGAHRVEPACERALAAEIVNVNRLERIINTDGTRPPAAGPARVVPISRYLRPASQYALAFGGTTHKNPNQEDGHDNDDSADHLT